MALQGYNIAFSLKIGAAAYKTIAGRTQDDLTVAAKVKESLTKDDAGVTNATVIGQDITFRATALVDVTSGTAITRDGMLAQALEEGADAVMDFKYLATGGKLLSGKCVITNLSESSNSSDEATLTVDFRATGTVTLSNS